MRPNENYPCVVPVSGMDGVLSVILTHILSLRRLFRFLLPTLTSCLHKKGPVS